MSKLINAFRIYNKTAMVASALSAWGGGIYGSYLYNDQYLTRTVLQSEKITFDGKAWSRSISTHAARGAALGYMYPISIVGASVLYGGLSLAKGKLDRSRYTEVLF